MCCLSWVQHLSTQPFLLFSNFVSDNANSTYWNMNSSWRVSHQAQKLAVSRQKLQFSAVTSLDCNFGLKIQRLLQNYVYRDRMLHVTEVNCFIFACLHPSSVKKLDVQNRNIFTYIRWRFISRITNITQIFHVTVGILLEVGALVDWLTHMMSEFNLQRR